MAHLAWRTACPYRKRSRRAACTAGRVALEYFYIPTGEIIKKDVRCCKATRVLKRLGHPVVETDVEYCRAMR